MTISLQPISDAAQYIWANPRSSAIKAGQGVASLAVSYVAYTSARQIHGIPLSCSCSYIPSTSSNYVDIGLKLIEVTALMIASVAIVKYDAFAMKTIVPPLDLVKSPRAK
jgi:hypothetical protein